MAHLKTVSGRTSRMTPGVGVISNASTVLCGALQGATSQCRWLVYVCVPELFNLTLCVQM